MSDNQELRRNWRANWLGSIQEFADDDEQRRLWLDPPNPHFSFGEYLCCYFDDLNLSKGGYEWAINESLVSPDEAAAVAQFHYLADGYHSPTDDFDHLAILADPKWVAVVEAAKRSKVALLGLIDDPNERRLLTEA